MKESSFGHHDTYMRHAFVNQDASLRRAMKTLSKVKFDTIAVQGVSGIVFGTLLAYKMKKNIAIVRKKGFTHSAYQIVTSQAKVDKFIFVDDLIDCGKTFRRVKKAMKNEFDATYVASYLYDDNRLEETKLT